MSKHSLLLLLLAVIAFDGNVCRGDGVLDSSNQPVFKLRNSVSIPLIGMGIGNLPHTDIHQVVQSQLNTQGVLLIDTAHASKNERLLGESVAVADVSREAQSFTRGGKSSANTEEKDLEPLHVVTKVWYTHLGYDRTKISIRESLTELGRINTRPTYVHLLLHWPRCNDDIPWMNCEEEENNLPQRVKDAGPPPHLNKDAFIKSWKALEDTYMQHQKLLMRSHKNVGGNHSPIVVSIGVSNFELDDMNQLLQSGPRIPPQMYQGNAWAVFHDPDLMNFLEEHNIFFQAYNVMNGILGQSQRDQAPGAYNILSGISRDLMATVYSQNTDQFITEGTVVLAYFVHSNIGVIPRAGNRVHQHQNSPAALSAILPHLTPSHIQQLEKAMPALMKGEELTTQVSFMNAHSGPIQIHWVNPETEEEVLVSNVIHPGSVEMQNSHPGHTFVAYDSERALRQEFTVGAEYGAREDFRIEEL